MPMKLIIAILRQEHLPQVQSALNDRVLYLMTLSEVLDLDQRQGSTQIYRGRQCLRPASRLRLEVPVNDACAVGAVDAIVRAACAGDDGLGTDSKIFVLDVAESIYLRTTEPCAAAAR